MTCRLVTRCSLMLLALSAVACGYDNGDRQRVDDVTPPTVYGSIETGQTMTDMGSGVGVFVEYATGGNWKMQVACDTATTDQDCFWDIYAYTPEGGHILSSQSISLETADLLTVLSDGQIRLQTTTRTDLDGVAFVTEPGAPVTFDLVLEGEDYPEQFFYYVSEGEVVSGADSPIIELTPTAE